ncbi:MAG: twin-arginine translocase subunit TatB [Acidimicrobiia bacterium]|nr:twin-arginine translocase subunit TatB [Acidimicrobiia bacterium]
MPDINFGEWIIIAVIALVVVGPRNLPDLAHKIGGWMREARAMATDFRVGLEREISELGDVQSDLKGLASEISNPLKEIRDELGSVSGELKPLDWTGPVTDHGPTAADAAEDFKKIHGITDGAPTDAEPEISPKRSAKNEADLRDQDGLGPSVAAEPGRTESDGTEPDPGDEA